MNLSDIVVLSLYFFFLFVCSYISVFWGLKWSKYLGPFGKIKFCAFIVQIYFLASFLLLFLSIFYYSQDFSDTRRSYIFLTLLIGNLFILIFLLFFLFKKIFFLKLKMAIKVAFFVYLINVFLFLILWFPFKKYFLGVGPVVDVSMEDTFHDHDMVLERIYPFCFKFYKPRVGDIVAFQFLENNERHYLAKRCVAISGDKIQIINNKVFLNGKKSYEPYVKIDNKLKNNDVSNYGPVTVEDGKIFVLGDNRRNSMDSRVIGRVPISSVCGEAVLKLWDNKKKKFCLSTLTY